MVSNPKGYRPKTTRPKYPLSVDEQRKLIESSEGPVKAMIVFMLSTGAHPSVLSDKKYNLDFKDDSYYSWNRPKSHKRVMSQWSKAMTEKALYKELRKIKGKSPGYYWLLISKLGEELKIPGVCPLQLRHTHYVNRARLGHNMLDISHGSGTSINTIAQYYTIGMGQSKTLSEDDRAWLSWLMEV